MINDKTVLNLMKISKLEYDQNEIPALITQLNQIMAMIDSANMGEDESKEYITSDTLSLREAEDKSVDEPARGMLLYTKNDMVYVPRIIS